MNYSIEKVFCSYGGCLRRIFRPHIYCDKHVDNSSKPTMSSLDDKLGEILDSLLWACDVVVDDREKHKPEIEKYAAQIKQVFADEGWQPPTIWASGLLKDTIKLQPKLMTGQEWFSAFMVELLQIQENRKLPMRAHHFVEAAKKASGVKK